MEYGSVLELDDIVKYKITDNTTPFWLPFMADKAEHYRTNFYQSGRNAIEELLKYLMISRKIKTAIIPDFVCQTVKDAAIRAGIEIIEYKVNRYYEVFVDEIENGLKQDRCVYICHFFGLPLSTELINKIAKWKEEGITIIEDITLSLFSEDAKGVGFGDYIIGSLRKWFPIPDGGFVSSREKELPRAIEKDSVSKYTDYYMVVQALKREYISGGCKDKELKDTYMGYYASSIKELFSDYRIYPMSEWSFNYIRNVNIREIIEKRTENYDTLYRLLKTCGKIQLNPIRKDRYLPFGMVLHVSDRDELLNYLIKKDIYCNVHWRLEEKKDNPDIKYLADSSITVPCDQRYSPEDMEHIAAKIIEWYK